VVRLDAPRPRAAALVQRHFRRGRRFRVAERVAARRLSRDRSRPSLALPLRRGGLAYLGFDGDDSETNPTAGGGLGYRWPIRSAGSVRIEAGYERLFRDEGDDADFFKLSVGVALRF
jgi:hypothetical protein